jgi:hypothetical protein
LGFCKHQNKRRNISIGILQTAKQETKHKHGTSAENRTGEGNLTFKLMQTTEKEMEHKLQVSASTRKRNAHKIRHLRIAERKGGHSLLIRLFQFLQFYYASVTKSPPPDMLVQRRKKNQWKKTKNTMLNILGRFY